MTWWRDAKFGMFIRWGLYAIPAKGEWVMNQKKIPEAEYAKLATQFNPVKFNATEWVRFAKYAGMKYIVITAKHHDGFALYGTKVRPFNIVDGTISKRWRAPQTVKSAWLEVELASPALIGAFGLDEPEVTPRLTQRFTLEAWIGGEWEKIAEGKTDGNDKNSIITPVTTQKFRLTVECENGSPGVAELHLFRAE